MTQQSPFGGRWRRLDKALTGWVALPGSPAYVRQTRAFNARFHRLVPEAIISCASAQDVAASFSFIKEHNLAYAIRSGGHCFAGRSSTAGVLIDMSMMHAVEVSADRVTVGPGARLREVYAALQERDLTLPAGTCPTVCVAGLALGGGLGILGRTYGVLSDRLLSAQIVLADGRILMCDNERYPDLFWALRGGGAGNFGGVTSLTFAPVPVPKHATNFHLKWRIADAVNLIDAWQRWAPDGPEELAASLKVTVPSDVAKESSVDIYGTFFGVHADALGLTQALVDQVGSAPVSTTSRPASYAETLRFWSQLDAVDANEPEPAFDQPYLISKSEFFKQHLERDTVEALVDNLLMNRRTGELRELDFMPWAGAYNRVRADATAFVHRSETFLLKHSLVLDPPVAGNGDEEARNWLTKSWSIAHRRASGRVFQNFPDPDLEDGPIAYYGTNLEPLTRIKARYDPGNFFTFHQSVPLGV
jgi:FAD/FMN-containing dehydrogenase